ncbi:restriction endonuclease subunit S [Alteromonas sp. ASW11-130]|uniref:restriction endonuclease subunit S n=1 Tax=Alteromonas sp. ASW11-130 TaxID=3015775 RepID=UPI0022426E8F|nr:restriction endonuclease subunit S [Alteromonas sp. ASW11-130]MCW8093396.1 restriction endonuclease subunit S [Alteromonas sp. ASW11-130]
MSVTQTVLGDIAEIKAGHPFRGKIPEVADGEAKVIQLRNATENGEITWQKLARTTITGRKSPEWLKKGDILFTARGPRNIAACLDRDTDDTLCAPHFFIVRVTNEGIDPQFLAWQLNQYPAQTYFQKAGQGSLVASITRSILAETPVKQLALDKQRTIAALAKTHLQEQALMQQLLDNRRQLMQAIATDLLA